LVYYPARAAYLNLLGTQMPELYRKDGNKGETWHADVHDCLLQGITLKEPQTTGKHMENSQGPPPIALG
jgi:hypothetical protein